MSMLKEKPFLTPNDEEFLGTDDAVSIQNAIDAAAKVGVNKVVIPRYNKRSNSNIWIISATIRVPSDMMLVLDNCHLQLAQDFAGQMLTNSLAYTEEGKLIAGTQTNIRILGKGGAILDGGLHNGQAESPFGPMLLYFHNVRDFSVEGFRVINQRGCGLCFLYCSYGKIAYIDFDAVGVAPQRDGIMLRRGCYNLTVEDITGYTGGHVVALAAFAGEQIDVPYSVMGHSIDVRNIIIKNIKATSRDGSSIINLFNQDGSLLYNILIETVTDISVPCAEKQPFCVVEIGDASAPATQRKVMYGETKNITVRNIFTHARCGVAIRSTLTNSLVENLHVHDDSQGALWVCPTRENGVATLANLLIRDIYCYADQNSGSAETVDSVFSFDNCEGKNITVTDVFVKKTAHLIAASGEITVNVATAAIDALSDVLVKKDQKTKVTLKNVKVKGEIQK